MVSYKKFKKKRKANKKGVKVFAAVFFSALISFMFVFIGLRITFKSVKIRKNSENRIELLKAKLENLRKQREALKEKIRQAKDKRHLEESFRQSFNMKKKGEKVVAFPSPQKEDNSIISKEEEASRERVLENVLENRKAE